MVAAPLATVSVPVELPSIDSETKASEQKPTYLTLQKDLSLVIGELPSFQSDQTLSEKVLRNKQRVFLHREAPKKMIAPCRTRTGRSQWIYSTPPSRFP